MRGINSKKKALKILVTLAIILTTMAGAVISTQIQNQNTYLLINAYIQSYSQSPNPVIREKMDISSNYNFTGNIYQTINVLTDNIVIDGKGYTVQGPGTGYGFFLDGRSNVTIKNVIVTGWNFGFYLNGSSYNTLSGNTANYNNNGDGFCLMFSSNNNLSGNTATSNVAGFFLYNSSYNTLSRNNATNNTFGFYLNSGSLSNDLTGSVVANYLHVGVFTFNYKPLTGADVKVAVDGKTVYASSGFGGADPPADQNGFINWILVPYQTYIGGTWIDNTTTVTFSFPWVNKVSGPYAVDTSSSSAYRFLIDVPEPYMISLYTLLLYSLLTPSGLNPLIYLALGFVAVVVVTVAALKLRGRREEHVFEMEVPTRYARTPTPQRIAEEAPKQEKALKVRSTTPTPKKTKCMYCSTEFPENAEYCPHCGEARTRCAVCNKDIISGNQYVKCPYCGVPCHRDHLLEWIKVKGYCPNCRQRLKEKDIT